MPCSGCFSTSQQEREARRIIQAKAKQYAQSEMEDMAIYKIEGEIKFMRLRDACLEGVNIEQIIMYRP